MSKDLLNYEMIIKLKNSINSANASCNSGKIIISEKQFREICKLRGLSDKETDEELKNTQSILISEYCKDEY
jgi:hypothetical protein